MNSRFLLPLLLAILAQACPARADGPASSDGATEPVVTIGAGTDLVSRYVFRGVALSEGAALQSSVWLSAKDLTLTVWQNLPLARSDGRGHVNEWDTSLAWEHPLRAATLELTATHYAYRHQPDVPPTTELSARFTRPVGEYEVYALGTTDVDAYQGAWIAEFGASRAWQLSPRLGLEAAASLLWGNRRFHESNSGASASGIGVVVTSLGLPYDLGHGLVLRPHLEWNALPDHRVSTAVGDNHYLTIGVSVGSDG
jgi:hypothetical protein